MKVDPIKFEVIRNGLLEATEEMAAALRRSLRSNWSMASRGTLASTL